MSAADLAWAMTHSPARGSERLIVFTLAAEPGCTFLGLRKYTRLDDPALRRSLERLMRFGRVRSEPDPPTSDARWFVVVPE